MIPACRWPGRLGYGPSYVLFCMQNFLLRVKRGKYQAFVRLSRRHAGLARQPAGLAQSSPDWYVEPGETASTVGPVDPDGGADQPGAGQLPLSDDTPPGAEPLAADDFAAAQYAAQWADSGWDDADAVLPPEPGGLIGSLRGSADDMDIPGRGSFKAAPDHAPDAGRDSAGPDTADPDSADPGSAGPDQASLGSAGPGTAGPGDAAPGSAGLGSAGLGSAGLGRTGPGTADP